MTRRHEGLHLREIVRDVVAEALKVKAQTDLFDMKQVLERYGIGETRSSPERSNRWLAQLGRFRDALIVRGSQPVHELGSDRHPV